MSEISKQIFVNIRMNFVPVFSQLRGRNYTVNSTGKPYIKS